MQKRNDLVLVLVTSCPEEMTFAFPRYHVALLIGLFALAGGFALILQGEELQEKSMLSYWFLGFLEIAFLGGIIFALTMNCYVKIDALQEKVYYYCSTLFRKREWDQQFSDFKNVTIFQPGTGAGRSSMIKVLLISHFGAEIPLGTSLFGIYCKRTARSLAQQIAEMMSLNIREELSLGKHSIDQE